MTRLAAAGRRLPLTLTLVGTILGLSVVTRTLWDPLATRSLRAHVTYGLPALEDGAWWTPVTGRFFAIQPYQYVPILLGLLVFGGFTEWRLGWARAGTALLVCHVVAVLGTALMLWAARDLGYAWTAGLAHVRDAGPSAGFLGAAAAASATLRPPWRGRLRAGLAAYVLVFVAYLGALADVEHVVGVAVGLALGPLLVGRRPHLGPHRLTRRDYRLLASTFFVIVAIEGLMQPFLVMEGPLAQTQPDELMGRSLAYGIVQAAVWFWLARSLYTGRRRAWRWAVSVLVLVIGLQGANLVWSALASDQGVVATGVDVVLNAIGLAILLTGQRAFRNPSPRRSRRTTGNLLAPADDEQRERAATRLKSAGTVNRLAWMTTWPENRWFENERGDGHIAYRVHSGVAIGLCDPVAPTRQDRSRLLTSFATAVHGAGLVPCLFTVTGEAAESASDLGWHSVQVAEEAVISLPDLKFVGKPWQDVRTALNQASKLGISLRLGPLHEQPRGIQMQVKAISSEWVADKGLPEMGFTLGGVDEALDPRVLVGLAVDAESTVHGITSWMPIHDKGGAEPIGWTLDVMRRLPGGFRYTMEFLISATCLELKDRGCSVVSLSGAPLARTITPEGRLDRGTLDAFLDRLGGALEPYYGFRSLHAFKAKFQPRNEPLFLVFPDEAALPRIGLALSRAYLPEAGVREIVTLLRSGRGGHDTRGTVVGGPAAHQGGP